LWTTVACGTFKPGFAAACTTMRDRWPVTLDDETILPKDYAASAAARAIPGFDATVASFRKRVGLLRRQNSPPPPAASTDACAGELAMLSKFAGVPIHYGPGQPGRPLSFRDPRSGILLYVESDGRHLAALNPDGVLLWVRSPFEDSKLCPYRNARPIIVAIDPATTEAEQAMALELKRKVRGVEIRFDSSQSGIVDVGTGDFVYFGRN
jgi:hypothetical protein